MTSRPQGKSRRGRLNVAIDRLASHIENGELLAATDPGALLDAASDALAKPRISHDDLALLIDAAVYLGERRAPRGNDVACGYCGETCPEGGKISHTANCGVGVARRLRSLLDDRRPVYLGSHARRTEGALRERCDSPSCPGLAHCLACPDDANEPTDDEISPEHAREMADWVAMK